MSEIRFYHLEQQSLDQVLPSLLSKALEGGHRIVIKTANDQEAKRLNDHLWTYDANSFLPHGIAKDPHADKQPVCLTSADENPNKADVLILTGGATSENIGQFKLCCEMLDGRNPESVSAARQRWKAYQEAGHDITYWQQGQKGWEKKAG